jgi:hypothetical protein
MRAIASIPFFDMSSIFLFFIIPGEYCKENKIKNKIKKIKKKFLGKFYK